jgi:hypothetical protein
MIRGSDGVVLIARNTQQSLRLRIRDFLHSKRQLCEDAVRVLLDAHAQVRVLRGKDVSQDGTREDLHEAYCFWSPDGMLPSPCCGILRDAEVWVGEVRQPESALVPRSSLQQELGLERKIKVELCEQLQGKNGLRCSQAFITREWKGNASRARKRTPRKGYRTCSTRAGNSKGTKTNSEIE